MPLHRLEWTAGFNSQATQTKNRQGWFAGNLVRWRYGLLEKVAGWQQLFSQTAAGIVRALHAYEDLLTNVNLLIGGDGGAQIYVGGTLYTFAFNLGTGDPGNFTVSVNSGTKQVTVMQGNFGNLQIGNEIEILCTMSIGGEILTPGTILLVTGVVPFTSFTFNLPVNASTTQTNVIPTPQFQNQAYPTINVTLINHGLITGNTFTFDITTDVNVQIEALFTFLNIPAGSTATITKIDNDTFSFNATPFGSFNTVNALYYEGVIDTGDGDSYSPSFAYVGLAPSPSPAAWFLDNLGTNGIVSYTNGPIYIYTPPIGTGAVLNNAGVPDPTITGSGTPQINAGVFVAMPQAQVIAFGSEVILGGGQQDPLLVRFSDAGSYNSWTATVSNQAGSFHLGGSGTKIVGGFQVPQTTLLWTNNDLWSMLYVGPPFIYSFTVIGSQCGLIAPHAFALIGRTTWWVTLNSVFNFSDSGITPIECPLWDVMFTDLDTANQEKIFLGASQSSNEVWIFYPSISGGTGECDKYLKVNILENLWDYGSLERSAWLPENAFGLPLGAETSTLLIQQHEVGYDANGQPMTGVYAETGYADVGDGEQILFVDEYINDMKWFGSEGAVSLTLYGVNYPGDSPFVKGPYGLDSKNRYIRPELRCRQIALRLDWAARTGFSARLGTPRVRAIPAGSRP